jgi:hypothetical protein
MIDLSKDVHDSLVVHLRRLEDCMDDRFIRKDNVVGERLLEGTLRGTDGLRAGSECSIESVGVAAFACEQRCGQVWLGSARGEGRRDPWSVQELSAWVKERRTREPRYKYALA